jgi:hypothetical protein
MLMRPLHAPWLLIGLLFLCPQQGWAQQPPQIQWEECLGGPETNEGGIVIPTNDHGFLVVASEMGFGWDGLVVKLNSDGDVQWQHIFGGNTDDELVCGIQTSTGEYLLAGYTRYHDIEDVWVIKLSDTGQLLWERTYGGTDGEWAYDIREGLGGSHIIAAYSRSADGDVGGNNGGGDIWLFAINDMGDIQWSRAYGGSSTDMPGKLIPQENGNLFLLGTTNSTDGDVSFNHGGWDAWGLWLSATGELISERTYGDTLNEGFNDALLLGNGHYMVAGGLSTNDGLSDAWLVELDSNWGLVGEWTYGGTGSEGFGCIRQHPGGGFALLGTTSSSDGDVVGYHGGWYDAWLVRVSDSGELLWQRPMGGTGDDRGGSMSVLPDGGYIMCALSNSSNGDVASSVHSGYDIWVAKLGPEGVGIEEHAAPEVMLYPNPASGVVQLRAAQAFSGQPRCALLDAQGRKVLSTVPVQPLASDACTLDLTGVAPGHYVLRVQDGREVRCLPLVVAH